MVLKSSKKYFIAQADFWCNRYLGSFLMKLQPCGSRHGPETSHTYYRLVSLIWVFNQVA